MKIIDTTIPDLKVIEPTVYGDERGFFMETYHEEIFQDAWITSSFVQDNHSKSAKWVLRGLHFQTRKPQAKLVRVIVWSVFDVAVDCRTWSSTYGNWYWLILSATNKKQLYVPRGFAHGFLTLENDTEFVYKCDDSYDAGYEQGIMRNDSVLWIPRAEYLKQIGVSQPILSGKDQNYASFETLESPFEYTIVAS